MHSSEQSGQALIELAISLPLLLLLLLGAAEFGRMAYMAIEVSDAAKAAVQYGAQDATTMIDTSGIQLAAQQNAPYVANYCTSFSATVSPDPKNFCTCMTNGTPNPTTPSAAACTAACAGYVVHVLQVTTTASCNPIFHATGFSSANITLNGSAVQEVLN
jgi:Flp pilus assembly protein TadG